MKQIIDICIIFLYYMPGFENILLWRKDLRKLGRKKEKIIIKVFM